MFADKQFVSSFFSTLNIFLVIAVMAAICLGIRQAVILLFSVFKGFRLFSVICLALLALTIPLVVFVLVNIDMQSILGTMAAGVVVSLPFTLVTIRICGAKSDFFNKVGMVSLTMMIGAYCSVALVSWLAVMATD